MKVGVVGSRHYRDLDAVGRLVARLAKEDPETLIVSGGAPGPDFAAEIAAVAMQMDRLILPARWRLHGKAAGHVRNPAIVAAVDRLEIFWDLGSGGTAGTLYHAIRGGCPFTVYGPDGDEVPTARVEHLVEAARRRARGG